jgi:hypothetical protein
MKDLNPEDTRPIPLMDPDDFDRKPQRKKDSPMVIFLYGVSFFFALWGVYITFGAPMSLASDAFIVAIKGLVLVCFGIFLAIAGLAIQLSESRN